MAEWQFTVPAGANSHLPKDARGPRSVPHVFFQGDDGRLQCKPYYDSGNGSAIDSMIMNLRDVSCLGSGDLPATADEARLNANSPTTWGRQLSDQSAYSMQSMETRESGRIMREFLRQAIEKRRVNNQHREACGSGGGYCEQLTSTQISSADSTGCASQNMQCTVVVTSTGATDSSQEVE